MPFWDSVSTHIDRADGDQAVALLDLLDLDLDGVRDLLAGAQEHLLADELGEHHVLGLVGVVLGREVERALGQQADEVVDQRRHALAGAGGDREDLGLGQPELGRRPTARGRCAAWLRRSTLLTAITIGTLGAAERLGDEAVPGPADALVAVDDEQRGVGLGQLGLDALLHARGQRVAAGAGRPGRSVSTSW